MLSRKWGAPARGPMLTASVLQAFRRDCPTCGASRDLRCVGLGDNQAHESRLVEPASVPPPEVSP